MKHITLLLLTTCLSSLKLFAQVDGNYNNTISLTGFSVIQLPKIFNQTTKNYINTYFNGGMARFNENQLGYRISGSYISQRLKFPGNCENCDITDGQIKDYAFKLGFEKSFNYSGIQPYFAFDLGYRYNQFIGLIQTVNNQKVTGQPSFAQSTKDGFTVSPVIGLRINFLEQFSFYAEGSPQFFYSTIREELTGQELKAVKTVNKYNKGEFLLNPVSVGVQFHLSSKN